MLPPAVKKAQGGGDEAGQVRYVFYDIESTQDHKMDVNGIPVGIYLIILQKSYKLKFLSNFQCFKHEANLICCEILCRNCMDDPTVDASNPKTRAAICDCGVFGPRFRFRTAMVDKNNPRLLAFHNFDGGPVHAVDQFLDFLLESGPYSTTTYVVAHNGAKYDLHILLEHIYRRGMEPKMSMTGGEILIIIKKRIIIL